MSKKLSHIDKSGKAKMVDVSQKPTTSRMARAMARLTMQADTLQAVLQNQLQKGDVITIAKLAGINGAKKTSDLIPLCHPLALSYIDVDIVPDGKQAVVITASVRTSGKTGVEMEALSAVSIAALTFYDMIKAIDKRAVISDIKLLEKSGGRSGHFIGVMAD
ncbi:MAG: cyclic pyranopterin monophosphate synthase MoaC [Alphaproteobacteria bacterium]